MTTERVAFRVSSKLADEARARASHEGVTLSDLCRRALEREMAAAPALRTAYPIGAASCGDADAQAALVQAVIAAGMARKLPLSIIYERAEALARLAAQHGRSQDIIVLATLLLGGAEHCPDPAEAARKRAEAVGHVDILSSWGGDLGERASNHLNQLADTMPPGVITAAREMVAQADAALAVGQ
jgi:hypothetical protein